MKKHLLIFLFVITISNIINGQTNNTQVFYCADLKIDNYARFVEIKYNAHGIDFSILPNGSVVGNLPNYVIKSYTSEGRIKKITFPFHNGLPKFIYEIDWTGNVNLHPLIHSIKLSKQNIGGTLKYDVLWFAYYTPEGIGANATCFPIQRIKLNASGTSMQVCANTPSNGIRTIGCLRVLYPGGNVPCQASGPCD